VSCVSVCFSTFAAYSIDSIVSIINQDIDGLLDTIDNKKVTSGNDTLTITKDTYMGSWYSLTKAYWSYVTGTAGISKQNALAAANDVTDAVESSSAALDAYKRSGNGAYAEIIKQFAFGETDATATYATQKTFRITVADGYDVLAWDDIAELTADTDREYYNLAVAVTTVSDGSSYVISDSEITNDQKVSHQAALDAIAAVLNDLSGDFDYYKQNNPVLAGEGTAEAQEKAYNDFSAFTIIGGLDADCTVEDVWAHYFPESAGWMNYQDAYNQYATLINDPVLIAAKDQFYADFMAILEKDLTGKHALLTDGTAGTGDETIRSIYDQFLAKYIEFTDDSNYATYLALLKNDMLDADTSKWDNIEAKTEELEKNLSLAYAAYYADLLIDMINYYDKTDADGNRLVPTYNRDDEADVAAWVDGSDGRIAKATQYALDAAALIADINEYVYDVNEHYFYYHLKDVSNKDNLTENNPGSAYVHYPTTPVGCTDAAHTNADGTTVATENIKLNTANLEILEDKLYAVNQDLEAGELFDLKAQLDSTMKSTLFKGFTFAKLQKYFNDFRMDYERLIAASKDPATKVVFELAFGTEKDENGEYKGLADYKAHLFNITDWAAERFYNQLKTIEKYYNGDYIGSSSTTNDTKGVTFYNYEAIIQAWNYATDRASKTSVGTLAWLASSSVKKYFDPTDSKWSQSSLEALYKTINDYVSEAISYQSGVNILREDSAGSKRADQNILDHLFDTTYVDGKYGWKTAINNLDWRIVSDFVNNTVELVDSNDNKVTKTESELKGLLGDVVDQLDALITSDDLGIVLDTLMGESVSGGLGTWTFAYSYTNAKGETISRAKGDAIDNVTELVIHMVYKLLYGGTLQNLLFGLYRTIGEMLIPLIGSEMSKANSMLDGERNGELVASAICGTLPLESYMFLPRGTVTGACGVNDNDYSTDRWHNFFDGSWKAPDGSSYSYPKIVEFLKKDEQFRGQKVSSGVTIIVGFNCGLSSWENWTTADWDETYWGSGGTDVIDSHVDLYKSLTAASCGLLYILRALFMGNDFSIPADVGISLGAELQTASIGFASIYDELIIPLFIALGISNYTSFADMDTKTSGLKTCTKAADEGTDAANVRGQMECGYYIWEGILEPILNWLDTKVAQHPVSTILEILPNLLTMIEYNQLLPKLEKVGLRLYINKIIVSLFNIDLINGPLLSDFTGSGLLNLGDMLGFNINELSSLSGALGALLGLTRTTTAPTYSDESADSYIGNYLVRQWKDADGNTQTTTSSTATPKAVYYNGYYYKTTMLSQTMYGLLGTAYIDFLNFNTKGVGKFSLDLPVNRLIAQASRNTLVYWNGSSTQTGLMKYSFSGRSGTVTGYHIVPDKGAFLLTLLRWVMDDGLLTQITPLIAPLLGGSIQVSGLYTGEITTLYRNDYEPTEATASDLPAYHYFNPLTGRVYRVTGTKVVQNTAGEDVTYYTVTQITSGAEATNTKLPETLLDTLGGALGGLGDYTAGILIALLNPYLVNYNNYTDAIKWGINNNNTTRYDISQYFSGTTTVNGTTMYKSNFKVNDYLSEYLVLSADLAEKIGVSEADFFTIDPTGSGASTYLAKLSTKDQENWKALYTYASKYNAAGYEWGEAYDIAQADLAVDNVSKIIDGIVPLLMELLGPMLEDLLPGITAGVKDATSLADLINKILLTPTIFDFLMNMLFGSETEDGLIDSLLGGLGTTLDKILTLAKRLNIDLTPAGFYRALYGYEATVGDYSSGSFSTSFYAYDEYLAGWLEYCADTFNNGTVSTATV
ncbi:MAG: hypothetical protein ACI4VI_09260, partial [Acutalibacteraceae bacterium]